MLAHTLLLVAPVHFGHAARLAWVHRANRELYGGTLVIVGMGSIGAAIARVGRAFGMTVSPTSAAARSSTKPRCCARFRPTPSAARCSTSSPRSPPEHPFWTLDNVILSPHTAALSVHEHARIVDLFCDNLRRYAAAEPLRNVVDTTEFY